MSWRGWWFFAVSGPPSVKEEQGHGEAFQKGRNRQDASVQLLSAQQVDPGASGYPYRRILPVSAQEQGKSWNKYYDAPIPCKTEAMSCTRAGHGEGLVGSASGEILGMVLSEGECLANEPQFGKAIAHARHDSAEGASVR